MISSSHSISISILVEEDGVKNERSIDVPVVIVRVTEEIYLENCLKAMPLNITLIDSIAQAAEAGISKEGLRNRKLK
jgi:hypothetical protein